MTKPVISSQDITENFRPPVVTILGHVDHGKTTLLDYIRRTNIAYREHGGITQHIGAYQIETSGKKITFIDTPGHEAFAKMRSQGAAVADIAILVVAANDGVMPQTIESINHIKSAGISCIVAITKIDLPDINLDKIKKQLIKQDLKLEEYGGEIPVVPLSAKTGEGIDKLLQMIILLSELKEIKDNPKEKTKAVVIESTLTKNRGVTATVILRNGLLTTGDTILCENQTFKIRAIINWLGENIKQIKAGDPAEILGWQTLPSIGSVVFKAAEAKLSLKTSSSLSTISTKPILSVVEKSLPIEEEKIRLIIKADTYGTLEAIINGLKDKKNIDIVQTGVGIISEGDIFLAKTTKSLVVGFQVKPTDQVMKLAESEKVIVKTYNIIYELFDELDEVIEAIKTGNMVKVLGEAKIIALFPIKDQVVAGVKVISGRLARGDEVKIMRGKQELIRTKIKSLRHGKEDITVSSQGSEAGVLLSHKLDLLTGDSIIAIG